ncbi:MAG: hypothetical protein ACQEQC_00040 [Elusimicrobiota bacterium]
MMEAVMDEVTRKRLYDNVDNAWKFVLKATKEYKKEFKKTANIGTPPHIDDVLKKVVEQELTEKEDKERKQVAEDKKE